MEAVRMMIYFFFFLLINVEVSPTSLRHTSLPVNFSITQSSFQRIYTARIKLGYPPQNFSVLIDTGSDITWIPCNFCNNTCSKVFHQYNTSFSTGKKMVPCPQKWCPCSGENLCEVDISYEDRSSTSGYFIEDWFNWMDTNTSPAPIIFGCSTYLSADFFERTRYDGILGLKAFSHCFNLQNDDGVFILGEALLPNLTYTPMVSHRSHFDLYLEKIMVNEQTLAIDPAVFNISEKGAGGTIIDSGTNYMFLKEEAYNELITFRKTIEEQECYLNLITSSIFEAFPVISLAFAQNATLVLQPDQYLQKRYPHLVGNFSNIWWVNILAWKSKTILGATVLKNKLVVYDVSLQPVGWADFDCSMSAEGLPVNFSIINGHNNTARQLHIRCIDLISALLITVTLLFY